MPATRTSKTAPSQDAPPLSIAELLTRARSNIESGETRLHAAARDIAAAYEQGATQCEIAEAVAKSQAWVCGLLKWRRSGWADTPFGPQAKAARELLVTNNRKTGEDEDEDEDAAAAADPEDIEDDEPEEIQADEPEEMTDEAAALEVARLYLQPMEIPLVKCLVGVERFTLVGYPPIQVSPSPKVTVHPLDEPWIEAIKVIGKERFHKLISRLSAIDADLNSDAQSDITPAESSEVADKSARREYRKALRKALAEPDESSRRSKAMP
jgi:hypothetical protein